MRLLGSKGQSGFSGCSTAEEVTQGVDGTGLTAIVTGASSGIGAETTRVLALRGVHVVMAVRNVEGGRSVKEEILKQVPNAKIDVLELDLCSFASVRNFASEFTSLNLPLNILINNAGVMTLKSKLNKDNIELHFATNHLGHFVLTNLLLETMKSTVLESKKEGRIINVSSLAHTFKSIKGIRFDETEDMSRYETWMCYGISKLANILHANELARRLKEEGVEITANSLHPGIIYTNILRNVGFLRGIFLILNKLFFKNIQQGAATTCYVALNPQVKGVTGQYFVDSNIAQPSPQAKDQELAKNLWKYSFNLTKTK